MELRIHLFIRATGLFIWFDSIYVKVFIIVLNCISFFIQRLNYFYHVIKKPANAGFQRLGCNQPLLGATMASHHYSSGITMLLQWAYRLFSTGSSVLLHLYFQVQK